MCVYMDLWCVSERERERERERDGVPREGKLVIRTLQ
jgi:hypothetical protein